MSQQFIQQLWEDAQTHVVEQQRRVETVAPAQQSWMTLAAAVAVVSVISAMFLNSESLLKSGARLAWPFAISEPLAVTEFLPEIEISVEPGDLELQRGSSVTIIARVSNAAPDSIDLRLQDDNVNWQAVSMNRDGSGSNSATYSYFIPSLQADTTYYVAFEERGQQSSPQYQINLFDLPQIEQINLAFDYPDYTRLTDTTEEGSGDMIVPEGTQVALDIQFNKAIATARVEFGESYRDSEGGGSELTAYPDLDLEIDGDIGSASFTVTRDGVYRIFATDLAGLESQEPLDYFIRAIEDAPPELSLRRPGRDQEVMPLEEVVLEVDASDDYGLSEFTLNYSAVGSDEVEVDFLSEANVRSVSGSELIYLEDLEVEPGDFVSYFLTLADNNGLDGPAEVISDIYFLQIIPTDQEFRRNPGMSGGQGAGGGQGGDSSALVSVQKDIIAATWKLRNRQSEVSPEEFGADAEIIAESQREATGRARMSIDRLAERLNFSDDTYDSAVENLSLAIEQMNLAAGELDKVQITSALQPEQLALQYILKAEANINIPKIPGLSIPGENFASMTPEQFKSNLPAKPGPISFTTKAGSLVPGVSAPPWPNELEPFASYNCIITLACLSPKEVNDPNNTFRKSGLQTVVLRSGGTAGAREKQKTRIEEALGANVEFFIKDFEFDSVMAPNSRGRTTCADCYG